MTKLPHALLICLTLALGTMVTSCSPFPELEARQLETTKTAGYPALVPVEPLLERAQNSQITPQVQSGLEGRVARLKARAARLRGAVVDAPTRQRMRAGVQS